MSIAPHGQQRQQMTPQERVRMQVGEGLVPQLAELLYRCDKGSPHARLTDLREPAAAVYVASALRLIAPEVQHARMERVQVEMAHAFATDAAETEEVARQAKADVEKYGARRFDVVPGGQR